MPAYSGSCLCGQSSMHITIEHLNVYAIHAPKYLRWLSGLTICFMTDKKPTMLREACAPVFFSYSVYDEYCFCPVCGQTLWYNNKKLDIFFIPWGNLDLTCEEYRKIVFLAEMFTDENPIPIKFTGQYCRLTTEETVKFLNKNKMSKLYF